MPLGVAAILVANIGLALGVFILGVRRWRDGDAYRAHVDKLAASGVISRAGARAGLSMLWLLGASYLVVCASLIVSAFLKYSSPDTYDRYGSLLINTLFLGVAGLYSSFVVGWLGWPRWLVPPHARNDQSPLREYLAERRARREARERRSLGL